MSTTQLREALLRYEVEVSPAEDAFLNWAVDQGVPPSQLKLFAECWVKEDLAYVGPFLLYEESNIMDHAAEYPQYLATGILVIGSCANGDMIGLDLRDRVGAVGYLSHEHLWSDDTLEPRDYFCVVVPWLIDFATQATGDDFPYDYYDAMKRERA